MNDMTPAIVPAAPASFVQQGWPDLLAELEAEMAPQNIIERIWLRDIAILSSRIDHLRQILVGLHRYQMYRVTHGEQVGDDGTLQATDRVTGWTRDPDELVGVQELLAGAGSVADLTMGELGQAFERMAGMVYSERLGLFVQLDSLATSLMRDRDKVLENFDNRRRELAADALAQRELAAMPPAAMALLAADQEGETDD